MKKKLLSMILVAVLAASLVSAAAAGHTDISGHWAESAIRESEFADVLAEDGAFLPNRAISRMEFARILHGALSIRTSHSKETDIGEYFDDVPNDSAGASELYDLKYLGIITASETFGPDEPLRRDEMIHYLISALRAVTNGEYAVIKMMPEPFDDDEKIDPIYKNDVIEAVLLNIINGKGNNMLCPDVPATRAEAVVAVGRLIGLIMGFDTVQVTAQALPNDTNDSLEMKLVISNNTASPIRINHTSGQKYDFVLFDAENNEVYIWSADRMFIDALTKTVIEPAQTIVFSETLDGDAYAAIKDDIRLLKAVITGTSDDFDIDSDGYVCFVP